MSFARTLCRAALAASLLVLCCSLDALAHGSCTALRLKASGKRCQMIARCYVRGAERGDAVAPCVDAQLARLEGQFKKTLLHKDCHSYGEPPDVVAILDAGVSSWSQSLQLDGEPCASVKLGAVGRYCLLLLRECYARAERFEIPLEQACLDEAATELDATFDKSEARYACATIGDASGARAGVDASAAAVFDELTVAP